MASLDDLAAYYSWAHLQHYGYLYKVQADPPEYAMHPSGQRLHKSFHPPLPELPGQPHPFLRVVETLVAAVNVKQLATTVQGPMQAQLEMSADASIAQVLDDYCGTPPRVIPWPWPGPPPWVFPIASELSAIANVTKSTVMRDGLLKVAGQVLERASGQVASIGR